MTDSTQKKNTKKNFNLQAKCMQICTFDLLKQIYLGKEVPERGAYSWVWFSSGTILWEIKDASQLSIDKIYIFLSFSMFATVFFGKVKRLLVRLLLWLKFQFLPRYSVSSCAKQVSKFVNLRT